MFLVGSIVSESSYWSTQLVLFLLRELSSGTTVPILPLHHILWEVSFTENPFYLLDCIITRYQTLFYTDPRYFRKEDIILILKRLTTLSDSSSQGNFLDRIVSLPLKFFVTRRMNNHRYYMVSLY